MPKSPAGSAFRFDLPVYAWPSLLVAVLYMGAAQAGLAQVAADIQVMLLETQLGACYAPPPDHISSEDQATVDLEIDATGALIGTPSFRTSPASAGTRAITAAAGAALQSCLLTRPDPEGETAIFQVLFAADGVTVVALESGEEGFFQQAGAPPSAPAENDLSTAFQQGILQVTGGETTQTPLEQLLAEVEAAGPSGEASEAALALSRTTRREIQGRLVSLGYDTRGVDGVFGPGSRAGISDWQQELPVPATGFLNQPQIAYLTLLTEDSYPKWVAARAAARPRVFRGSDGCARTRNDERTRFIILGRSGYCNLRALGLARPRR